MGILDGDNLTDLTGSATLAAAGHSTRHNEANTAIEDIRDAMTVFVNHGATAATARPAGATRVLWEGSVAPTNGASGDYWWDTTNELFKRYDGAAWNATGSGTFAQDDEPIWTPAPLFVATNGSPALSYANGDVRPPVYLLDGAADERVSATILPRTSWTTCNIVAVIEDAAGTGGDVRLEARYRFIDDGGDTSGVATTNAVTATVAAPNLAKHVTLAAGVSVSAGLLGVRVVRYGADVADTHTGDIAFLGLRIEKAS